MMRRVAGKLMLAFGGRDAGWGRARLAHQQLPPVVVVGLASASSALPRDCERWGGAPLRRDARY
jgi:hypothetical protein